MALPSATALRGARAGGLCAARCAPPSEWIAAASYAWRQLSASSSSTAAPHRRPFATTAAAVAAAATTPLPVPATAPPAVYGAPFTNSIAFAPAPPPPQPPAPGAPAAAPAYELRLRVPDLGQGDVALAPGDSLAAAAAAVARVTGASDVRFACNGRALRPDEAAATRVDAMFGTSVDVQLDGLRYSVNRGLLLAPAGSVAKRSAAVNYALVAAGGAVTFAGCFAFWHSYLGVRHNKIKQLLQ